MVPFTIYVNSIMNKRLRHVILGSPLDGANPAVDFKAYLKKMKQLMNSRFSLKKMNQSAADS